MELVKVSNPNEQQTTAALGAENGVATIDVVEVQVEPCVKEKETEVFAHVRDAETKLPMHQQVIEGVKFFGSFCLVAACAVMVIAGVALGYSVFPFPSAALFVILFFATILLGYLESAQIANVTCEKWDMTPFRERFPRACETQKLVNNNKLLQRFIVGRQFFVLLVVFIIAQVTTFPDTPTNFLGMPAGLVNGLIKSGIPGIIWVLTFGQLTPQLFMEEFTLPFMNCIGFNSVTRLAFAAEFVGICHFSWLLFHTVTAALFGNVHAATSAQSVPPGESVEDIPVADSEAEPMEPRGSFDELSIADALSEDGDIPESQWDKIYTAFRFFWSTCLTLGAVVVIMVGIANGYYVFPASVAVGYIIFFGMLILLFHLEGMMVGIVATRFWNSETFKDTHPIAYRVHTVVNKPNVLKRFIIGRQFLTVITNFLLAQVTVFANWPSDGYDPILFFIVIKFGLAGVLVTLAFAQLLPELLAARHPLFFLNNYLVLYIVHIALCIEALGIGHGSWLLFKTLRGFLCTEHIENKHMLRPNVSFEDQDKKEKDGEKV